VDGNSLPLRANSDKTSAGDNTALSAVGIVFLSVLFVFLQGREAVLKADKEIKVYTNEDRLFTVEGGVPVAATPAVAPAPAPSPAGVPTAVESQVVCERVADTGDPVGAKSTFPLTVPSLATWFQVAPASADRTFMVRWTCDDEVVTTSTVIVRANQPSGGVTITPAEGKTFQPGNWKVEIFRDGQSVSSRGFLVGR